MILDDRLDQGDLIILDGATGSELRNFGAVLNPVVWCGMANHEYPDAVQGVHEAYIRAGADVITTNTFATCRHVLDGAGLGERTVEINQRAVELAVKAREAAANGRDIAIAGSMSSMFAWTPDTITRDPRFVPDSGEILLANFVEQAQALKEAGVDFLILEMMRDTGVGPLVVEAANATGLSVWIGLSASCTQDGHIVAWEGTIEDPTRSYASNERSLVDFTELIDVFKDFEPKTMGVMHSTPQTTVPALTLLRERWTGPIMAYPETIGMSSEGRREGVSCSPEEFSKKCADLVANGVQIIGGCCGTTIAHLRALTTTLNRQPNQLG